MRTLSLACVAAAAVLVAAAGCAAPRTAPRQGAPAARQGAPATPAPGPAPSVTAATAPVGSSVFGPRLLAPDLAVADGSLYLSWERSAPARLPPPMIIARASPVTGQITAENEFSPGFLSVPLYAAGWLWVTDMTPSGELLFRLDPRSLMVTGELKVAGGLRQGAGPDDRIAFAGNSIWVDGLDRLVRVAPQSTDPERVIRFPGATSSDVAASGDGRTLIVSEAGAGSGAIQRRDPVTGALLASHPTAGVNAPLIGGVSGAGAWIAEPAGTTGYVERISIASMKPEQATQVEGPDAIRAAVWNGVLWVISPVGGSARNYCADPGSGRRLATLPFAGIGQDTLLGASGTDLFYSRASGAASRIESVPIPAACLGGRQPVA